MKSRNPFLYPRVLHRRRLAPGPFADYKRYKPYLRDEFSAKCVYCRLPDGLKGTDAFHIDHYEPKQRGTPLISAYKNLFYSCASCNVAKGAYWPTKIQLRKGAFVPNPCDHVMTHHLSYRGAEVTATSDTGKFAIALLKLNDERSTEYRAMYRRLIDSQFSLEALATERLAKLKRALKRTPSEKRKLELQAEVIEYEGIAKSARDNISALLGD